MQRNDIPEFETGREPDRGDDESEPRFFTHVPNVCSDDCEAEQLDVERQNSMILLEKFIVASMRDIRGL